MTRTDFCWKKIPDNFIFKVIFGIATMVTITRLGNFYIAIIDGSSPLHTIFFTHQLWQSCLWGIALGLYYAAVGIISKRISRRRIGLNTFVIGLALNVGYLSYIVYDFWPRFLLIRDAMLPPEALRSYVIYISYATLLVNLPCVWATLITLSGLFLWITGDESMSAISMARNTIVADTTNCCEEHTL